MYMSNLHPREDEVKPSTLSFILHRDADGYSELTADSTGQLYLRRTQNGKEITGIPLGSYSIDNLEQLQFRLEHLLTLLEPQIQEHCS